MRKLLVAILLASASGAAAQTPRNGPEWGGKDHQPTEAGVIRREGEAKVRAPPARVEEDNHTVKQLDQELLHDEAVDDPPRNPDRRAPP